MKSMIFLVEALVVVFLVGCSKSSAPVAEVTSAKRADLCDVTGEVITLKQKIGNMEVAEKSRADEARRQEDIMLGQKAKDDQKAKELVSMLRSRSGFEAVEIVAQLVAIKESSIPELVKALADDDQQSRIRGKAVICLRLIGKDCVHELINSGFNVKDKPEACAIAGALVLELCKSDITGGARQWRASGRC